MAEVGGQQRQPGGDVAAVAVPVQQRGDREAVPQIMRPGPAAAGPAGQSGAAGQRAKRLAALIAQPGARAGHQQRVAGRAREQLVAEPQVVLQRGHGGRVQREQPVLAELGVRARAAARAGRRSRSSSRRDGFADAHAGDRQQADQGLDGRAGAAASAAAPPGPAARRCRRRNTGRAPPGGSRRAAALAGGTSADGSRVCR